MVTRHRYIENVGKTSIEVDCDKIFNKEVQRCSTIAATGIQATASHVDKTACQVHVTEFVDCTNHVRTKQCDGSTLQRLTTALTLVYNEACVSSGFPPNPTPAPVINFVVGGKICKPAQPDDLISRIDCCVDSFSTNADVECTAVDGTTGLFSEVSNEDCLADMAENLGICSVNSVSPAPGQLTNSSVIGVPPDGFIDVELSFRLDKIPKGTSSSFVRLAVLAHITSVLAIAVDNTFLSVLEVNDRRRADTTSFDYTIKARVADISVNDCHTLSVDGLIEGCLPVQVQRAGAVWSKWESKGPIENPQYLDEATLPGGPVGLALTKSAEIYVTNLHSAMQRTAPKIFGSSTLAKVTSIVEYAKVTTTTTTASSSTEYKPTVPGATLLVGTTSQTSAVQPNIPGSGKKASSIEEVTATSEISTQIIVLVVVVSSILFLFTVYMWKSAKKHNKVANGRMPVAKGRAGGAIPERSVLTEVENASKLGNIRTEIEQHNQMSRSRMTIEAQNVNNQIKKLGSSVGPARPSGLPAGLPNLKNPKMPQRATSPEDPFATAKKMPPADFDPFA